MHFRGTEYPEFHDLSCCRPRIRPYEKVRRASPNHPIQDAGIRCIIPLELRMNEPGTSRGCRPTSALVKARREPNDWVPGPIYSNLRSRKRAHRLRSQVAPPPTRVASQSVGQCDFACCHKATIRPRLIVLEARSQIDGKPVKGKTYARLAYVDDHRRGRDAIGAGSRDG